MDVFTIGFTQTTAEHFFDRLAPAFTALLCSEADAAQCHRSLVVAYLDERWGGMNAVNL